MRWRRALRKGLERHGIALQRWPAPGTLAHELASVLRNRAVDVVLDVGAHTGGYGLLLRSIGFEGAVHSFEPNPNVYRELARKSTPSWTTHELGLGESVGTATLKIFSGEQLSSLHSITPWAAKNWRFDAPREVEVRIDTVDQVIARMGIDPTRTLLKVDTQGHDAAVLAGAAATIDRLAALQIEMPVVNLYEGAPTFIELMRMVVVRGFRLVGLFPVQRELVERLVPIEFDGLFVRSDLPIRV